MDFNALLTQSCGVSLHRSNRTRVVKVTERFGSVTVGTSQGIQDRRNCDAALRASVTRKLDSESGRHGVD
jgi:hypothetical protein